MSLLLLLSFWKTSLRDSSAASAEPSQQQQQQYWAAYSAGVEHTAPSPIHVCYLDTEISELTRFS